MTDLIKHFTFLSWHPILRILFVGTLAYFFLLIALRSSAPRVLARTNVFDFIIVVGIGSAFGRVLTAKEVALVEACTAFTLLVTLQYVVSKLRHRFKFVARLTDARPQLLFHRGQFIEENQANARLTLADLNEAVRIHGLMSFDDVDTIVLEASGDLSVIRKSEKSFDPASLTSR